MVISHFRRPPPLCKMPPKDDIVALSVETRSLARSGGREKECPKHGHAKMKGQSSGSDLMKRWGEIGVF